MDGAPTQEIHNMKAINTLAGIASASLLFLGLYEAEYILSLAMATCLVACFMIEAELI